MKPLTVHLWILFEASSGGFKGLLHVIILNTISKRQDGSDLFRILHTKSFSKFTEASMYYVMHYVVT